MGIPVYGTRQTASSVSRVLSEDHGPRDIEIPALDSDAPLPFVEWMVNHTFRPLWVTRPPTNNLFDFIDDHVIQCCEQETDLDPILVRMWGASVWYHYVKKGTFDYLPELDAGSRLAFEALDSLAAPEIRNTDESSKQPVPGSERDKAIEREKDVVAILATYAHPSAETKSLDALRRWVDSPDGEDVPDEVRDDLKRFSKGGRSQNSTRRAKYDFVAQQAAALPYDTDLGRTFAKQAGRHSRLARPD